MFAILSGLATKQRAAAALSATSAPAFTCSLSNMEGQRRPQSPFVSNSAGLDTPSGPHDNPGVILVSHQLPLQEGEPDYANLFGHLSQRAEGIVIAIIVILTGQMMKVTLGACRRRCKKGTTAEAGKTDTERNPATTDVERATKEDGKGSPKKKDEKDGKQNAAKKDDPKPDAGVATAKPPVGPPTSLGPPAALSKAGAAAAAAAAAQGAPVTSTTPSVTPTQMLAEIQKVASELQMFRKSMDAQALEGKHATQLMQTQLKDIVKTLTAMGPRMDGLESIAGTLSSKMGPLSKNAVDIKTILEREMGDMQKALFSASTLAKGNHDEHMKAMKAYHDEVLKALNGWGKEILHQLTQKDFQTSTALTRVLEQHASEILAACHYQQTEIAEIKGITSELASTLESSSSEVHLIREYCERPVPAVPAAPTYRPVIPGPSVHDPARPPLHDPTVPARINLQQALPSDPSHIVVRGAGGSHISIPLNS